MEFSKSFYFGILTGAVFLASCFFYINKGYAQILEDEISTSTPLTLREKLELLSPLELIPYIKSDLQTQPLSDIQIENAVIELDQEKTISDNLASKYSKLYDSCKNK